MNEEIEALLKKALDSIKGARLLFDDDLYGCCFKSLLRHVLSGKRYPPDKRYEFFKTSGCGGCFWAAFC